MKTRQHILEAALDLFSERGVAATSVQDVAERTNADQATVFDHFRDEALLYTGAVQMAGDRLLQDMEVLVESNPTLAEALQEWIRALRLHKVPALTVITTSSHLDTFIAPVVDALHGRFVDFWQRQLELGRGLPDLRHLGSRELARVIVASALVFANASDGDNLAETGSAIQGVVSAAWMAVESERRSPNGSWPLRNVSYRPPADPLPGQSTGGASFRPRELEVLLEVEKGASNKEIANALGITVDTVKYHLKKIFKKLSVGRRTEALKVARDMRII